MVSENLIVVLDGATARTDTRCVHGIAWYAVKLAINRGQVGVGRWLPRRCVQGSGR